MKESDIEGIANHNGLKLCGCDGNIAAEALVEGSAGVVYSPEINTHVSSADPLLLAGRQHDAPRYGKRRTGSAGSETHSMYGSFLHGNREAPSLARVGTHGPREEPQGDTFTMYGFGASDRRIVPEKPRTTGTVRRRLRSVWRKGVWPRENGYNAMRSDTVPSHVMACCSCSGASGRDCHSHLPLAHAVDPRQEPGAVVPHAGICAGGAPKGAFLPRLYSHLTAPFHLTLNPKLNPTLNRHPCLDTTCLNVFQDATGPF